jgi:hypothetical protein
VQLPDDLRRALLQRRTDPRHNGRAEYPLHGLPADIHPDEGIMVALRTYGEAMQFLRTWYSRRFELVVRARQRGLSRGKIARLMRVDTRTIGRWEKKHAEMAARYDELLEHPPEETGW